MSAALEQQVAEEQAEHDALHAADDPEGELFPGADYESEEL